MILEACDLDLVLSSWLCFAGCLLAICCFGSSLTLLVVGRVGAFIGTVGLAGILACTDFFEVTSGTGISSASFSSLSLSLSA